MSKQAIDNITRAALWHAYGNKCFLCTQPLDWDALHIDHLVAEHMQDDVNDLTRLIEEYGLPAGFSVNDFRNLVPVHSRCNLRKGGIVLDKTAVLYYLAITTNRLPHVIKEIDKLTARRDRGKVISSVQAALQIGLIPIEDFEKIIADAKAMQWQSREIRLPMGIEFVDQVYDLFYVDKNCDELLDKKIMVAGSDEPLELNNDDADVIMVSTLRQYRAALEKGFYPLTTFAIKMSSTFEFLDDLIKNLQTAKMPKVSFISEPWIEITDLDHLSPNVLEYFEDELDEYISKGMSIGELVRQGIVQQEPGGHYPLVLKVGTIETYLCEQFRADFNGDGIEDIFVRGYMRVVDGTLGYGFTKILTRKSENGLIEVECKHPC